MLYFEMQRGGFTTMYVSRISTESETASEMLTLFSSSSSFFLFDLFAIV